MMAFNAGDDAHEWFNNTGADPPHSEHFLSEVFHARWMVYASESFEELNVPERFFVGDPEDCELDEEKYTEYETWCVEHPQYHSDCIEWVGCVMEIQEEVRFFQNECGGDLHSYYGVSRSDFA